MIIFAYKNAPMPTKGNLYGGVDGESIPIKAIQ